MRAAIVRYAGGGWRRRARMARPPPVFLFRRGGAREGEQLLARLDAAGGAAGVLAIGRARRCVGVVLVDGDHLIDAVGQLVHQRVFGDAAGASPATYWMM